MARNFSTSFCNAMPFLIPRSRKSQLLPALPPLAFIPWDIGGSLSNGQGLGWPLLTIKAAPPILVVDMLCEAIFLEQLMGRMLELGQRLRGTAIAANCRCSFGRTGAREATRVMVSPVTNFPGSPTLRSGELLLTYQPPAVQ